jgi:hypothetical protein
VRTLLAIAMMAVLGVDVVVEGKTAEIVDAEKSSIRKHASVGN